MDFIYNRCMEQSNKIMLIAELHGSFHAAVQHKVTLCLMVLEQGHEGNDLASKLQEAIVKWGNGRFTLE